MAERKDDPKPNLRPVESVSYLRSPLITLTSSLDDNDELDSAKLHDLLDAYSTLFQRIRTLSSSLSSGRRIPALSTLSRYSDAFARCLQRDLRRALTDPLHQASQTSSAATASAGNEQAADIALDVSMVCQYAMHFLTQVFRFPSLYSLFSDTVLSHLLDDLLVIVRSTELPCIDSENTYAAAFSVLSTFRLPETLLAARRESIVALLRDLVTCISPRTQGSKVVHHILSIYPATFLPHITNLLPEVLTKVVSSDASTRIDSTSALCGYASAVLSTEWIDEVLHNDILKTVRKFIVAQLPSKSSGRGTPLLPQHISSAIREGTAPSNGQALRWAVTVVCCLIVLSGRDVFVGARACRFVLQTSEQVIALRTRTSEDLLGCIWRCLVWAFAHIPPDHDISIRSEHPAGARLPTHREIAFGIVKQELRGGAGASLVAALLQPLHGRPHVVDDSDPSLGWAVGVLKDIVSHKDDKVYSDGSAILARMVSAIGTSSSCAADTAWTPASIVNKALFSHAIHIKDFAAFGTELQNANRLNPTDIRSLSEEEIKGVWDELSQIWTICVHRELARVELKALPDSILATWQALLLVQTHLTQERGHLTATQEFTDHVVSTVCGFLEWTPPSSKSHVPTSALHARVLSSSRQLWSIVRNVFSDTWVTDAAKAVFARLMQRTYDLSISEVQIAWSQLCAALLASGAPGLISSMVLKDDPQRTMALQKGIWRTTARKWDSISPKPSWLEAVDFLAMPLGSWSVVDEDRVLWDKILDATTMEAAASAGSTFAGLDALVERLPDATNTALMNHARKLLLNPLARLRSSGEVQAPCVYLRAVGSHLRDLYSDSPDCVTLALQAMGHIRQLIKDCPSGAIVTVLIALADGLSVWIGDEREYLLVQEHNDVVVPLYCEALYALRSIPISSDTLHALAHFLYSAFIRIPDLAGPLAFYEFWMQVQPTLDLGDSYPDDIKAALGASTAILEHGLTVNTSHETESQTEKQDQGDPTYLATPFSPATPIKLSPNRQSGPGQKDDSLEERTPPKSPGSLLEASLPTDPSDHSLKRTPSLSKLHSTHVPVPILPAPVSWTRHASRGSTDSHMPTSPTNAMRAQKKYIARPTSRLAHEKASRTPDRPLKRRKMTSPLVESATDSPVSTASTRQRLSSPLKRRREFSPIASSSLLQRPNKRSLVDNDLGVDVAGPTTPKRLKGKGKMQEELLSPEVPSPATASTARFPSSDDDYDAWEVPIAQEDENEHAEDVDVVPDSQPGSNESDSLIPSFMKPSKSRQVGEGRDEGCDLFEDTMPAYTDVDDFMPTTRKRKNKSASESPLAGPSDCTRRGSPVRMRTAPASFLRDRSASPTRAAAPIRRAQTATAQLEELRNMCDVLQDDGSQLNVDQIVTATALTHQLGAVLSEKLSKKLSRSARGKQ